MTERERRKHKRFDLSCPVKISINGGHSLAGETLNISNADLLAVVPSEALCAPGTKVVLTVSVPRVTPNTFMYEEFTCLGFIARLQTADKDHIGVAIQFVQPLELLLEV